MQRVWLKNNARYMDFFRFVSDRFPVPIAGDADSFSFIFFSIVVFVFFFVLNGMALIWNAYTHNIIHHTESGSSITYNYPKANICTHLFFHLVREQRLRDKTTLDIRSK